MSKTLKKVFTNITHDDILPSNVFDKIMKRVPLLDLKDDETFYEPLYSDFENFDDRIARSVVQPIFLNDFDFNVEEDRDKVIELLRTEYPENNFSTVGSCNCGKYKANMYINSAFRCDECGSEVTKPLQNSEDTKVWLRLPDRVSGFINPAIYETFLSKLTTKTPKVSIVEYWINSDIRRNKRFRDPYKNYGKIAQKLELFRESLGIEFGYNSFVENIDLIVTNLIEHDVYRILDANPKTRESYSLFWNKYKDRVISKVFPLPNKIITIVESDNRNKYYTKEQLELNNLFQTLADLHKEGEYKVEENPILMGKMNKLLINALESVHRSILFGKKGTIRYHAGAGKLPFTGRSIVTGDSGVTRSDIITLPYQFALTCLDKHLTNWLYRRGYTPLKVKAIIREAAYNTHPLVNEFLDWVESNNFAMATVGRNPSIQYLSARSFIVRFNRDIEDKSIRVPITTVTPFGMDFDGDQAYVYFLPDLTTIMEAYSSWGHHQMLDPNVPFKLSRFYHQTKTNLLNINSLMLETPIEED